MVDRSVVPGVLLRKLLAGDLHRGLRLHSVDLRREGLLSVRDLRGVVVGERRRDVVADGPLLLLRVHHRRLVLLLGGALRGRLRMHGAAGLVGVLELVPGVRRVEVGRRLHLLALALRGVHVAPTLVAALGLLRPDAVGVPLHVPGLARGADVRREGRAGAVADARLDRAARAHEADAGALLCAPLLDLGGRAAEARGLQAQADLAPLLRLAPRAALRVAGLLGLGRRASHLVLLRRVHVHGVARGVGVVERRGPGHGGLEHVRGRGRGLHPSAVAVARVHEAPPLRAPGRLVLAGAVLRVPSVVPGRARGADLGRVLGRSVAVRDEDVALQPRDADAGARGPAGAARGGARRDEAGGRGSAEPRVRGAQRGGDHHADELR
mmetsp:Transcript_52746/g.139195  ORF Transcript_52746/g.139195 Transcript_52746/m.139195 type:complete len:381 (-) Transcript_52746:111-1253(-)